MSLKQCSTIMHSLFVSVISYFWSPFHSTLSTLQTTNNSSYYFCQCNHTQTNVNFSVSFATHNLSLTSIPPKTHPKSNLNWKIKASRTKIKERNLKCYSKVSLFDTSLLLHKRAALCVTAFELLQPSPPQLSVLSVKKRVIFPFNTFYKYIIFCFIFLCCFASLQPSIHCSPHTEVYIFHVFLYIYIFLQSFHPNKLMMPKHNLWFNFSVCLKLSLLNSHKLNHHHSLPTSFHSGT